MLAERRAGATLSSQAGVLRLQVLQPLDLIALQPAELLAPAIIRHLGHANLADRVSDILTLRDQNINLSHLRDDLFRLVSLPRHCSPPSCQKTYLRSTTSMGEDHLA